MLLSDRRFPSFANGKVSQNVRSVFPELSVIALACIYACTFAFRGMPISEGWYTEYAWQINNGAIPYVDFSLLFPPVYSLFIATFTSIFGYGIVALRVLGVVVFALEALLLYKLYSIVFKEAISVLASITSVMFIHAGLGDGILYDYMYVLNVLSFASLYCLAKAVASSLSKGSANGLRVNYYSFIAGVFSSLGMFIKQSTGAFLLVFCICVLIGCVLTCRIKRLKSAIAYFMLAVVMIVSLIVTYLFANGAWSEFISNCIIHAASAKGGIAIELFQWIDVKAFLIAAAPVAIILMLVFRDGRNEGQTRAVGSVPIIAACFLLTVICVVVCYRHEGFSHTFSNAFNTQLLLNTVFLSNLLIFIYSVGECVVKHGEEVGDDRYLALIISGAVFVLGWACGMSGGLAYNQLGIGAGLLLCLIFDGQNNNSLLRLLANWTALFAMAAAIMCFSISNRYVHFYNWWGLSEGSIWDQTATSSVPLLEGIKMPPKDAEAYDAVWSLADDNLKPGDELFVFPHCPIFYSVCGSHAETYSIVQWFDVSSMETLKRDFGRLEKSLPKMLIICRLPEGVMAGHEQAFGTYQTRWMQDRLFKLASEKYNILDVKDMGGGYNLETYVLRAE